MLDILCLTWPPDTFHPLTSTQALSTQSQVFSKINFLPYLFLQYFFPHLIIYQIKIVHTKPGKSVKKVKP